MTGAGKDEADELVRNQTFPADGPLDLDVALTAGRVDVRLGAPAQPGGEALVEVRHDPAAQSSLMESMASVLTWVGQRFGDQLGTDLRGEPADAVAQVHLEQVGNRLVVRGPTALPLRNVPLVVTVHAPAGSHLDGRTGAAGLTVTGTAGHVDVTAGSGAVRLERAEAPATVRTGSGAVRLGPAHAGVQVKTGSGDVEASEIAGSASVVTGTGGIRLGSVAGEILARSGSGDLTVAEAVSGTIELITGSGEVRIGVRRRIVAEIDVSAGSGTVTSELDVAGSPPDDPVGLTIRARTGSGNALVTSAR